MIKTKILLVEDEQDFGFILKKYLEMSDYEVFWYQNPEEVLQNPEILTDCQLALLDVMMPNIDGFTLAKSIQKISNMPFLFLTAKNQQIDRIYGLKLGAEDYISKPCDPEELILRMQNILKHVKNNIVETIIQIGCYTFDPKKMQLSCKQKTENEPKTEMQNLTAREVDLLLYLLKHNDQMLTREAILENVWKTTDYFTGRSMDVFMSRLRKYFVHDNRIKIQSVRGVGFHIYFPI